MPLGAFFINIDVGTFKKIYERYSADLQSDYYIIDRDGRIIACSDNGRCAQPIAQYIDSLKLNTQEEQSCVCDDVVYTISRVSEICGWRVVKAAKRSTVFAYESDILKFILLGTIILLLLESGVIYFLVSRFTQPITSIKTRLKQITEGDMSIRFDEGDQHPVAEIRDMNMMLQEMLDEIPEPRAELSPYAPRIISMQIDPDDIRTVIGPGGKTINRIIAETGVKIDIDDTGLVYIAAPDMESAEADVREIELLTKDPEPGEIYEGKVTRVMPFGAFIEILPGKEGLLHISKMAKERVEKVEDVMNVGDIVRVKVTEIDSQNKINLSRKELL